MKFLFLRTYVNFSVRCCQYLPQINPYYSYIKQMIITYSVAIYSAIFFNFDFMNLIHFQYYWELTVPHKNSK